MSLLSLFKIINKYKILLACVCAVSVAASCYVAFFLLRDEYRASAIMIISSQKNGDSKEDLSYSEYTLNVNLVNTYRVLCKTDNILNKVLEKLDAPLSVEQLRSKLQVESENGTEIFRISARDSDPELAAKIANFTAQVFENEIPVIIKMDNVQIIDKARPPDSPVAPNRSAIVLFSLAGGLVLCACVIFLAEHLDTSVKTEEALEEMLQVPVISSVPHFKSGGTAPGGSPSKQRVP